MDHISLHFSNVVAFSIFLTHSIVLTSLPYLVSSGRYLKRLYDVLIIEHDSHHFFNSLALNSISFRALSVAYFLLSISFTCLAEIISSSCFGEITFVSVLASIHHPSCTSWLCPWCHYKTLDFIVFLVSPLHLYILHFFPYKIPCKLHWIAYSTRNTSFFGHNLTSLPSLPRVGVSAPTWPPHSVPFFQY